MTGKYRDEIDGLRAISVLAVILFHMGYEVFRGGFLGVDVFFVISGYLITGILVANPTNLKDFYIKRIRRIMPPMLLVVGVSLALASYLFLKSDLFSVSKQAIAALLSLSNVYTLYASAGYWSEAAEQMLFLHLWSLSLEEQFYLLFPFVVLVLRNRNALLRKMVLLGMIISFIACVYFTAAHPSASFYLLPTRAWELLAGSYCAINFKRAYSKGISTGMSIIGILMVIGAIFFISESNFPGWKPIIPVVGTCLLLVGGLQRSNPLNALLSIAPAKWIGKLSYSLYLWHWPVIIFSKYLSDIYQVEHPTWPLLFIMFILASFSYYLVEKPLRFGKHWKLSISSAFILVFCSSTIIFAKRDLKDDASGFQCSWDGMKYSCVQDTPTIAYTIKNRMAGINVSKSDLKSTNPHKSGITFNYSIAGKTKTRVIVFGDSHALMWSELLHFIAKNLSYEITYFCADGTPIYFGNEPTQCGQFTQKQKYEFDLSRIETLKSMSEHDILVLSSRWDSALKDINQLDKFLWLLPKNVKKILTILQPPVLSFGDINAMNVASKLKSKNSHTSYVNVNKRWLLHNVSNTIQMKIRELGGNRIVVFLDTQLYTETQRKVRFTEGNKLYYIDDDHLSTEGTFLYANQLIDIFKKLGSKK